MKMDCFSAFILMLFLYSEGNQGGKKPLTVLILLRDYCRKPTQTRDEYKIHRRLYII